MRRLGIYQRVTVILKNNSRKDGEPYWCLNCGHSFYPVEIREGMDDTEKERLRRLRMAQIAFTICGECEIP